MSARVPKQSNYIADLNTWREFRAGLRCFRRRDFRGAIKKYRAALRMEPASALIQYNLGLALMEAHRFRQGLVHFDAALEADPKDYEALGGKSECLFGLKEFKRAISTLNRAIRLQPQRCFAYYNKGVAFEESGEYSAALREFSKAIRLARTRKERTDVYFYSGLCHFMLKRFSDAADDFADCARLNPEYPNVFWALGDCLIKLGDRRKAMKAYRKHLRRNPKDKADISSSLKAHGLSFVVSSP